MSRLSTSQIDRDIENLNKVLDLLEQAHILLPGGRGAQLENATRAITSAMTEVQGQLSEYLFQRGRIEWKSRATEAPG